MLQSMGSQKSATTEQLNWTDLLNTTPWSQYYLCQNIAKGKIDAYKGCYTPQSKKAMATHSSTLGWKIPRKEEPGRLQTMGSLRVEHDWVTSLSLFTFMCWRRKWQPTPLFLPRKSQGRRVGHDWSDLAAAAYPPVGKNMKSWVCIYSLILRLKAFIHILLRS